MMSNQRNGTLYTGMTTNLIRRVWEHKNHVVDDFTKDHNLTTLVYYERAENIEAAAHREKNIKAWQRAWKIRLIEENNPFWSDLYPTLF